MPRSGRGVLDAQRVSDAKSNARYSFLRTLDNTNTIANLLANYAQFERSPDTINKYYRTLATITPAGIQATANKYFTDANLVVTTLSKDPLPEAITKAPAIASLAQSEGGDASTANIPFITQKSALPNVMMKLLFHRLGERSAGQGRARRSLRVDDQRSRLARGAHRATSAPG